MLRLRITLLFYGVILTSPVPNPQTPKCPYNAVGPPYEGLRVNQVKP